MIITYHSLAMIKIQQGDKVAVFNPIGKTKTHQPVKFGADLALVSFQDSAYSGTEFVARGDRVPFVIDGPGEYEVGGAFVKGLLTAGPANKINVAYALLLDGIKLVHLGILAGTGAELSPALIEELGVIDVLFIPIAGEEIINAKQASKIISDLEPKMVIPVHYTQDTLKIFLKEMGKEGVKSVESLALKKKDLLGQQLEVVIITSA